MTTSITILNTIKPPLRWVPEAKEFTTDFLQSKSKDSNGPSFEDLTVGPNSVLHEAQRILGRCLPPTASGKTETGLVVGYVQSGKTLSFETVIALARDNGYGLVIVLAGTKVNLREQSEERLKKDLGIDDGGDHWYHLSNPTDAARSQIEAKIATWKKKPSKKSLLITVLKHGGHLEKLAAVLKKIDLSSVPALIIDDESDQASLNTKAARIRAGLAAINEVSTTYKKILRLRGVIPHHSYLQYTATPQANLLLAQTDFLNPDFAELVTPGDAYTGGQAFFVNHPTLIADIPAREVPSKTNDVVSPPKSLLKSLRFFFLAAAQHSLTREKGRKSKDRNRSMIVHPAVATTSHKTYKAWVDKAYKAMKGTIEKFHATNPSAAAELFREEYNSLKGTFPAMEPLERLITEMVDEVFDELNIVLVNGTPDAEKKINWKTTRYWILVGGAKLDRGYTVEGLCVTYMPRPLGTSAAADTLQQRARFFGYKASYLGTCRVFLQASVAKAFTEYVEHEDFVRSALEKNRGKPLTSWRRDFVLTEMLKPTRPNVIGLGVRHIPVDGWLVPRVLQRDDEAADKNRRLLDSVVKKWTKEHGVKNAATVIKGAATSQHNAIEGVPLRDMLDDFLLEVQVKDPTDAEEHSAMIVALADLLAKNPSAVVDVFLMNRLDIGYRTRVAGRGAKATDRFAPINQYFSQSAGSINDRDYCSSERVSLQLRRFDLGTHQRDPSRADIKKVTWFALNVPKSLRRSLYVEERR
ncbi:Z1 domain-containing protein [Ralstonia mannitolilytica]|uniref:Z1 domain-containing protein n=1 Tax=Ralstonia mannitolilytica TaxID=105219 RepID=UPI000CEEA6B5|nr:Z1 domain-containing protein [Ralstonia mannitolilytica]MBU9579939.1 Z1 domain-containing protein [Ralstonia mannitolilytica]